jgi:sugar/nucleoside kinase (ribokinase family)
MADVVSAGIIVVDHVAAPVDRLPSAGELVLTHECFLSIGGCASNVAVDVAKMGISVSVAGLVGEDSFGAFAKEYLATAGVETDTLLTTDQAATSQTLIVNVKGQDRRFIHHIGANRLFSKPHFPMDAIRRAKVLYVGGFFLMGLGGDELAAVFREVREAGVLTMLDVVTPSGEANHFDALGPALRQTDVFHLNADEGRAITGREDPVEQADLLHRAGARTVVVTCGGDGAVLVSAKERLKAGAFPTEFVDGTGGGDAFDAGYICGLLEGGDARRCLELGSALGASCVRKSGATAGVFTAAEADAFLRSHRLDVTPIA